MTLSFERGNVMNERSIRLIHREGRKFSLFIRGRCCSWYTLPQHTRQIEKLSDDLISRSVKSPTKSKKWFGLNLNALWMELVLYVAFNEVTGRVNFEWKHRWWIVYVGTIKKVLTNDFIVSKDWETFELFALMPLYQGHCE